MEESSENTEGVNEEEAAANRACAVSKTEKRASLITRVALNVHFSFCASLWTSSS